MSHTAELDLVDLHAAAARGDVAAFEQLVTACHEDMRRVCVYVTRDERVAEEAVQAAWSIAWRRLGSIREPARVRGWLMRIAINEAKRSLRIGRRRSIMEIPMLGATGTVAGDPQIAVGTLDLRAALARLEADDRALLALRYVVGFNATELAEVLGITPSGTRNRLDRLLARLRRELAE